MTSLQVATAKSRELGMLRLIICGSVDDGKSTLIGRLLLDSEAVHSDQLAHIAEASRRRGAVHTDLSLLTDGLRAERQQGITIDVAHRFFSTPRRHFALIDAPGHEQYTSNMVTGASQADVAVILLDATKGMTQQTRRHAYLVHLLQIPAVVFAVNKMDLVGHSRDVYSRHVREVRDWCRNLDSVSESMFVPVSALEGDNVAQRTTQMAWYEGPSLLEYLEGLEVSREHETHARLFVQVVIRDRGHHALGERGYAGRVVSGGFSVGQSIWVLPQKVTATIRALERYGEPVDRVSRGQSVTVFLNEELDVGRGDLLCDTGEPATVRDAITATLVWTGRSTLSYEKWYALRIGTRWLRARVVEAMPITEALGITRPAAPAIASNDIVRAQLRCSARVAFDAYQKDRTTGAFILVDEESNETAAAGMLETNEGQPHVGERSLARLLVGTDPASIDAAVIAHLSWLLAVTAARGAEAGLRVRTSFAEPVLASLAQTREEDAGGALRLIVAESGWYGKALGRGARDVARVLACRVVVVVSLEPGCFNRAMLTVEAMRRDGVVVEAWLAVGRHETRPAEVDAEYGRLQQTLEAPHWGLFETSSAPSALDTAT